MKVRLSVDGKVEVADPGRGRWKLTRSLSCGCELEGFDGENHLYVFVQAWQSGHRYITVVHCRIDSENEIVSGLFSLTEAEDGLNKAIRQTARGCEL